VQCKAFFPSTGYSETILLLHDSSTQPIKQNGTGSCSCWSQFCSQHWELPLETPCQPVAKCPTITLKHSRYKINRSERRWSLSSGRMPGSADCPCEPIFWRFYQAKNDKIFLNPAVWPAFWESQQTHRFWRQELHYIESWENDVLSLLWRIK